MSSDGKCQSVSNYKFNYTMEKERRYFSSNSGAEIRASKESRAVEGYAVVFNKESRDFGGWKEVIAPEAMDGVLENADVLALMNHDETRGVLARYTAGEGTLTLTVDTVGVKYRFDSPETALGSELLEGIERKDIRTSSFAFGVAEGGQKWERQPDDSYIRTITSFAAFYDVSPVYREAYPDTTVAKRSFEEVRNENIPDDVKKKEEKKKEPEAIPPAPSYEELSKHYSENEAKINKLTNSN